MICAVNKESVRMKIYFAGQLRKHSKVLFWHHGNTAIMKTLCVCVISLLYIVSISASLDFYLPG